MKKHIVIIGVTIGLLGLGLGVWRLSIVPAAKGIVCAAHEPGSQERAKGVVM